MNSKLQLWNSDNMKIITLCIPYSLNAVEWKSTLFGVMLGITSFGVDDVLPNYSGIRSEVVVESFFWEWIPQFWAWSSTPKRSDP